MSSFTCGSCPSCSETFSSSQVTAVAEARALQPLHWGMLRFLSVYSHFSQNLATLLIVKELFCCLLDLFSLQSDGWIWTLSLQAYQGNILTKGIDLFQCKTFWKPSKKHVWWILLIFVQNTDSQKTAFHFLFTFSSFSSSNVSHQEFYFPVIIYRIK